MAKRRPHIPQAVVDQVLFASKRACCLCFHFHNDSNRKKGQIAHLDHNRSNNDPDNLAWMCLDHHDEYDSKTSQARGLARNEAKHARERLYAHLQAVSSQIGVEQNPAAERQPDDSESDQVSENEAEFLLDMTRSGGTSFSKALPPGAISRARLSTAASLAAKGLLHDQGTQYSLSESGIDEAASQWQIKILGELDCSPYPFVDSNDLAVRVDIDESELMRHLDSLWQLGAIYLVRQMNFARVSIEDAGRKFLEGYYRRR